MTDSIHRLHEAVRAARAGQIASRRTAKLFARGRTFIAKKVAEEAVEVALDGAVGDVAGTVRESADLLYNLVVLWADLGIEPAEIWSEMQRREHMMGMAEKLPKPGKRAAGAATHGAAPATGLPLFCARHGEIGSISADRPDFAARHSDEPADAPMPDEAETRTLTAPPLVPGSSRRSG